MTEDPPRFFLVSPPLAEADSFTGPLSAALDACDAACVLIRPDARAAGADAKRIVRALAPLAQDKDVALIVPDDPQLAVRSGADGCQIGRGAAGVDLAGALKALKPDRIVGAGALGGRDDAMTAGEMGVDYLMFGGPDDACAPEAVLERVAWWAEIFTVPCVAYAASLAEIAPLVAAGADFVALGEAGFLDPRGPAAAFAEAQALLESAHAARLQGLHDAGRA
ncbi:thiamine phosphate synthase [Methylocella sp.]|uniref:thiamine phosphate synthase n=1 Tax=Methylocella sp. TaxID=1978226 RepID=UPI003783686D